MTAAKQTQMLTREQETALVIAWQQNQDYGAREKLLRAFRPLVIKLAVKVANETGAKTSHEDLVQEGWIAITEAVSKFDLEKENGFSAYVRHPILSAMRRFVMDMSGSCRIGTNANDKIVFFRGRKVRADFARKNNREATEADAAELAKAAGVPVESWLRMTTRMNNSNDISLDPSFTHGEIDDETEDHSISRHLHSSEPSPEAAAIDAIDTPALRQILEQAIGNLPEKERIVIVNRLVLPEKLSLFKLAKQLRLSKKHVREIEERAKLMLKNIMVENGFSPETIFA